VKQAEAVIVSWWDQVSVEGGSVPYSWPVVTPGDVTYGATL